MYLQRGVITAESQPPPTKPPNLSAKASASEL